VVTGHIDKLRRRVESVEKSMCWKAWVFREWNDCRNGLTSAVLCDMFCDAWERHNTVKEKSGCDNFGNHIIRHDDRKRYGMEKRNRRIPWAFSLFMYLLDGIPAR
jgi:hypothetical protein